jgi:hypothetical protein
VRLTGEAKRETAERLDELGLTGGVTASPVGSPPGLIGGWLTVPAEHLPDPSLGPLVVTFMGDDRAEAVRGPGPAQQIGVPPVSKLVAEQGLTGDGPALPVTPNGGGGYADASPVMRGPRATVSGAGRSSSSGLTGEPTGEALDSPVGLSPSGGDLTGGAEPFVDESADKLSDAEVVAMAWDLRPEGPFSANWLVSSFRIGTGRATRLYRTVLAPELIAKAARAGAVDAVEGSGDSETEQQGIGSALILPTS